MKGKVASFMKRRKSRLIFIVAVLAACGVSTQAARRELVTPVRPDDAFTRALSVITQFGYTVEDADRPTGFIRAELRSGSFLLPHHWQINVMLLPDSAGSGTRVVVQPGNLGDKGTVGEGRILGAQQAHVDSIVTRLRSVLARN